MKASTATVLSLLRSRGSLTALECLYAGGGQRLPARIWELEQAGFTVTSSWETTPNGARVKRFRLVEKPVQQTLGIAS